jgi:hypothetical protein
MTHFSLDPSDGLAERMGQRLSARSLVLWMGTPLNFWQVRFSSERRACARRLVKSARLAGCRLEFRAWPGRWRQLHLRPTMRWCPLISDGSATSSGVAMEINGRRSARPRASHPSAIKAFELSCFFGGVRRHPWLCSAPGVGGDRPSGVRWTRPGRQTSARPVRNRPHRGQHRAGSRGSPWEAVR